MASASINEALRMIAGEDEEDELAGMIAARLADLKNGANQHKKEGAPIGAPSTATKPPPRSAPPPARITGTSWTSTSW
jgi:hypothetical protein